MHLAQVLQMALHEKNARRSTALPEKKYVDEMKLKDPHKVRNTIIIAGAFIAAFAAIRMMKRSK